MTFELQLDQPLAHALARRLEREINSTRQRLDDAPDEAAIHAARRHIKKARAALRLLEAKPRAVLADVDHALRQAGRALSPSRDQAALLRTADALTAGAPPAARRALLRLCAELAASGAGGADDLQEARAALEQARLRLAGAMPGALPFARLADGFAGTYRCGRRALRRALDTPSAGRLHALRRALKHHLYQLRLLRGLWPALFDALEAQADQAAEQLGQHHDLAVLRERLATSGLSPAERRRIDALARRRQDTLTPAALLTCRRLYAERTGAVRCRLLAYAAATQSPD
ncbi:CHAD domain-containing protein [Immundisolibacter sp.]|uniref:CHAD domain-containing protein n=1 Tax=Immundisolibacter sp. TaxID=1934948 RepID=UPI00260B964E|nr:CHAD domain-containing protein [Immundisolibacter sp.]MDD3652476.1 CHAD domain-containing protein [Immundisolibacter sp.]